MYSPNGPKYFVLLAFFLLPLLLSAQAVSHKELFNQQILLSCQDAPLYRKEVRNLALAGSKSEVKESQLTVRKKDEDTTCILIDELSYAFDRYSLSPKMKEFFEVVSIGDSIIAIPLPEKESSAELKQQKLLLSPDGKTLRYVESLIIKDYWLYSTRAHIWVEFDEEGKYLRHELEVSTEVVVVGKGLDAIILGKAEY